MFFVIRRAPAPFVHQWPGRRWFAVMDAAAWPALWILGVSTVPFETGLSGRVVVAFALCSAVGRTLKAGLHNERYQFTTWRWTKFFLALALVGLSLKLVPLFQA